VGLILILVALFLPPLSLLQRLGILGYTRLDAENPEVSHLDGVTMRVDPETFTDRLRVRLDSVPQLHLLEGSAGSKLLEAVKSLPDHLEVKSPFYQLDVRGKTSQPVMIDVVVPNEAEPWQTLDLYTWTGEEWTWVGSNLHTEVVEGEFVRARLTDLPENVVVVQTKPVTPTVSALMRTSDSPVSVAGVLNEVNPNGLLLGTMGGFAGDPNQLPAPDPAASYATLPTLRNWAPGASVNTGLLSDVLNMPSIQEQHISNIVQLCQEKGFAGVEVDYRGVGVEGRDAYSAFIEALAQALHEADLRLNVAVEPPTLGAGGWDTGGYDWAALGAAADALKVPFPDDPAAYVEGGETPRLLDWATAQVSRYKLHMRVNSLCAAESDAGTDYLSMEDALATFGEIVPLTDISQPQPGGELSFGLTGALLSIAPQTNAGTYRLECRVGEGDTQTIWLGTPANLATKLSWAQNYHLGGISIVNLMDSGNAEGVIDAVASYRTSLAAPESSGLEVVWTVEKDGQAVDQQTSPLTEPTYAWQVPETFGTYTVRASIGGFDRGSLTVDVADPALAETETLTETEEVEEEDEEVAETEEECLDAAYVADVTVPDNTQFENGEAFEKTWRVRNSGSCDWPEDTVLAFASGHQMGAPESVEVGALEAGGQTEVTVNMTAPDEAGRHTGTWRMRTAEGVFGGNLTVVIQAGEEVADTPSAPITPVSGGSFELGGHVRDMALPYAERMHYAGMNWSKVQVHYGQDVSGIVAGAHAKGFKIQLSALGSPDMVTRAGFEDDYARWVASMAATGADAIEVWNEPNIEREWQIGHISPQAYTNLLCKSYNAIKAANAGTAVISAAPAPTGFFGGCGPNGCDDQPWLEGLAAAGAANCMDYIGAHHNAGATSPSATIGHPANPGDTHHSWFFLPQTRLYYNIFGGARQLFYTEMGYASQEGVPTFHDAFGWARGTDNAEQAAWLAEAVQLSVNTGMVRCIIVWNIDFVRYGYDPQDGFAIIRPDGSCPACESLHAVLGTR
jgi:hypothetical protein